MAYRKARRGLIRPLRRNRKYVKRNAPMRKSVVRRRRYPARRSNRKAILNITSRKKQDSMQAMKTTPFGIEATPGPLTLTGDQRWEFMWVATARDNVIGSGVEPGVFNTTQRTATSCYMRGLKERLEIRTGSSAPWVHRRIVFTFEGDALYRVQDDNEVEDGDSSIGSYFKELSSGYVRAYTQLVPQISDYRDPLLADQIHDLVFKGKEGTEWVTYLNAKTDNLRINVLSDTKRFITSGNDRGVIRNYNIWQPFNKTLVYNDDENGNHTNNSPYSVQDKRSMGDVYVYDIFLAGWGSNEDDELHLSTESTLYWHER